MKAYIYIIKNLTNFKVYIGSSKHPNRRKYDHFHALSKGTHPSCHLQRAYKKYGKDSFEFSVIEECSSDNRKERELYHISFLRSHLREFGYNIDEPDGSKFTCSAETKEKIRQLKKVSSFRPSIPVDAYSIHDLSKIGSFSSQKEAESSLNIPRRMVFQILSGVRKSYKGITFVLKDQPCSYTKTSKCRDMSKFYK